MNRDTFVEPFRAEIALLQEASSLLCLLEIEADDIEDVDVDVDTDVGDELVTNEAVDLMSLLW